MKAHVSFFVFFISNKNTKSRELEAMFTLVGVTSVAYCHDVKRENLTFWQFQNYVKSDLMSNNMTMNDDMCN